MSHRWGEEFERFKWKCAKCGTVKHHVWHHEMKYTTQDGRTSAHAPACSGPALRTLCRMIKRKRAPLDKGEDSKR